MSSAILVKTLTKKVSLKGFIVKTLTKKKPHFNKNVQKECYILYSQSSQTWILIYRSNFHQALRNRLLELRLPEAVTYEQENKIFLTLFPKEPELVTVFSQSLPKPEGDQGNSNKTAVLFPFPHPLILPPYAHKHSIKIT